MRWTAIKETEERRTKVPHETRSGTLAGREEFAAELENLCVPSRP